MNLQGDRKEKIVLFSLFFTAFFLRIVCGGYYPPGFTADEATMGYDAYSLLKTGRDQFGNPWPFAFRSFGDYRPPLYVYATVPFVAMFGLTPLAVRLPSLLAGSLEVVFIYILGKELFRKKAGFSAAVLFMFSPWSLLHTRFAQEVNVSTLTILIGVVCFVLWVRHKMLWNAIASSFFFSLSFYAYHNARITTLLLLIGGLGVLGLSGRLEKKQTRQIFVAGVMGILLLFPLLQYSRRFPEAIFRRASGQSIFMDPGINGALWKDIVTMPAGYPVWLSRLRHNKPLYFGRAILKGYFSHFNPNFLFISGDPHERFRTPYSGLLNWTMLFFLPVGFFLFLRGNIVHRYILFWLLASPVVASLSTIVPNSQHAQDMTIPLHLIGGTGTVWIFDRVSHIKRLLILILFIVSFSLFFYGYTQIIPYQTKYLQAWHYYGNLFKKLSPFYGKRVFFLGGQYYINLVFFLQYDPSIFQREVRVSVPNNLTEFDHVQSFASYEFLKTRDIPKELDPNALYVRLNEEGELLPKNIQLVDKEVWPDGKREYVMFQLSRDLDN